MMSTVLSVNEVIDRAGELDGTPVEIVGLLTFEFENHSLNHFPKAERREITEAVDPPHYQSSVWIAFGTGSIQPNQAFSRAGRESASESLELSVHPKGHVVVAISAAGDVKLRRISWKDGREMTKKLAQCAKS
jgi:hypothetical protein